MLITGGSKGLGFELAKLCVKEGAQVIIIGRNGTKLEEAEKLLIKGVTAIKCDISNPKEVKTLKQKVGEIDVLVNNAGILRYGSLEQHTLEDIVSIVNTNLTGLIMLTNQFIAGMKDKHRGAIINISSTSGLKGSANESVYVATKWGIRGFSESLKAELESSGVDVFAIYPGGMKTDIFTESGVTKDISGFMNPKYVAEVIVDVLKRSDNVKINSIEINRPK